MLAELLSLPYFPERQMVGRRVKIPQTALMTQLLKKTKEYREKTRGLAPAFTCNHIEVFQIGDSH